LGNIESSETIILFFFIGIATLGVMGFPSFMSHMQSMTPEAFAEEQKLNVLSNYYYQPIIASSYLVMPISVVLPPPDPTMLFETMYAQPIQLEFGIIENGIQEFLIPNINKLDFLPTEINKFLNDFEVLPKAFAITTNQNKNWEWREHDRFALFTPVITAFQSGEKARLTSTGGSIGDGYIMKSFNITEITGSDITIKWEDTTGGTSFRLFVVDGNFSASSLTDFPDESGRITKGAGTISSQIDTILEGIVIDTLPASSINYSDSTEGVVTVLVYLPDTQSTISQTSDVYQIDISTIGNYTFNQNSITTVSGTENDYGYFNTTFTSLVPDQVTGLVITQEMNNNATLDWNDIIGSANYQVFRNETLIASPILSEFIDSTLSLGMIYEYKVRENTTGGFGLNSTIINFGLIDPIGGLNVTALNSTAISIEWDLATTSHPTDSLIGIEITRNGTLLTTVDDLDISFIDNGLIPETHYQYVLKPISTNSTGIPSSQIMPFKIGANYDAGTTNFADNVCPTVANPTTVSIEDTGQRRIIVGPSNSVSLCSRNAYEFDTSEISVGSTITNVTFRYDVNSISLSTTPRPCSYNSLELQPSITNHQDRWDDIANGTLFTTNNDCNTVALDYTISNQAMIDDLQENLDQGEDWWGLGQKFTSEARTTSQIYSVRINSPELQVEYTGGFGAGATTTAGSPDQVTGLNITQNMNNNATLDWNDATLANNYQVLRLNNFTSGGNVNANGTWQFREQQLDAQATFNPSCTFLTFSDRIEMNALGFGSDVSDCYLFKTFPRELMNGSQIQINYDFSNSIGSNIVTLYSNTQNEPNQYDRNNELEWKETGSRQFTTSDPGVIDDESESTVLNGGRLTANVIDGIGDWATVDTDYSSIVFKLIDTSILFQNTKLKVYWINITDFTSGDQRAFYNFSGSTVTLDPEICNDGFDCKRGVFNVGSFNVTSEIFEEIGTTITSDFVDSTIPLQGVSTYKVRGNGTNGFGLNSTEVDFGLIQQIDSLIDLGGGLFGGGTLNATAINSTAIKLTWDQATTEHPSDPLTGVLIQRNGTTITTVDDLAVSYIDNGLTSSTSYSYRLKGVSAVSTGSFGTNNTATTSSGVLPPEKPINLNSTAVQRDVLLEWTQPDGDGIITGNATDFEIKRNGTTIVSSIASTFAGVFNDDFGTYTSNASGNLIWESSNCPGTSGNFCGVNVTSDSLKTKWASKDNSGISYDIFSNLGINVTDASGNGKFQLLFKLTLQNHFGSNANNMIVGLSDEDHLSGRLNTQNFLGARYVDNAGIGIPSNQIVTFMADDENLAVFVDIDGDVGGQGSFDTTGLPRWWNMTYDGTNLYTNVYDCAEQNSGCLLSSLTSNDGAEVYDNLRYLKMIPIGLGSTATQNIFEWDDFQLFVNGTSVLTTYIDKNPGLDQTFNYAIIPSNSAGDGIESDQAVVTTNDFPNIPTSQSAMSQSGSEIEVTWISPTDYGAGSPTTGITPEKISIFKENTTDTLGFFLLDVVQESPSIYSDKIVDSGKNYTYKLAGTNSIGNSGNTTEVIAFTSNNTVIFTVFENDLTTTLQNLAMVTIDNGIDSETKLTDPAGKVQFFEKVGNYNIIVKEIENDFVILKANQTFIGTGTELFNLQTLVFRVNCAVNDPPTDPDVRIIVNQTDAHLVTAHSTPVCVKNVVTDKNEITWTETFTSDSASGSIFTSKMIADVLRADTFGTGNEVFEISTVNTGISYDSGLKKLSSVVFDIGTGLSSPSFAFLLVLDEVAQSGGGNTGGPTPNPTTNPPIPGGGGAQSTSSPAPFGEFQLPKLSITSDTLFLIAGERFESDIFIDWNVDDNFVITGVRVDKNPRWFAFESTPKPFNAQGAFGTANLGFIIQLDPSYCNPNIGVTVNCVERGEVIIPITIEGIVGGKKVEEQHFLTIDTSERFGIATFLIIFFVIFLIIALAVASNRASKNNKKKVQQKVKKRVPQKNKKKGSTVERLRSRR